MFGSYYLYCKNTKSVLSIQIFFAMLCCMVLPLLIYPDFLEWFDITINFVYTVIFGILIISGLIPWMKFDRFIKRQSGKKLYCSPRNISKIKLINNILILTSIYCIVYLVPYAILGILMDAADLRSQLQDGDFLLPESIFTTLSVGFAALNIYCILMFYISFCFDELRKYRILLFISSLSNIVSAAAFAGRDQFVVIIIFYIVFFLIVKPFLNSKIQQKLRKVIIIMTLIAGTALVTFTMSRFWLHDHGRSDDKDIDYLLVGTVGYIAEQPLVFNSYIEKETIHHGIKKSFPLINNIFDLPAKESWNREPYSWQFGTMYAAFFSMFGWPSMILGALIFWGYYTWGMERFIRQRKLFPLLLLFCVYLYLEVTGIFYLKAAGSAMINLFYIVLSIIPFFIGDYIKLRPNERIQ